MSLIKNSYLQSFVLMFDKFYFMGITIFIARQFTINDYGLYQRHLLISSLVAGIVGASLPYIASSIKTANHKLEMLNSIFIVSLFISLCCSVVFSLILFTIPLNSLQKLLLILLVFTQILFPISKQAYIFNNNIKKSIYVNFIIYPIFFCIFIITNYYNILDVTLSLMLFVALNAIIFIMSFVNNVKSKCIDISTLIFTFKNVDIKVAFIITVTLGLTLLIENLDQIFLLYNVNDDVFAFYKIGSFRLPFIEIMTGAIAGVIITQLPTWYKNKDCELIYDEWRKVITITTYFLIPIVIFCIIQSKMIISFLFGEKYTDASILYSIYLARFLFSSVTLVPVIICINLQKSWFKYLLPLGTIELSVMLLFSLKFSVESNLVFFALIPLFFQYIFVFFQYRLLKQKGNINIAQIFPWKFYFFVIFISIIMCLAINNILVMLIDNIFILLFFGSVLYYACTLYIVKKRYPHVKIR